MNILKGLPGEPRLQGALSLTDTDEVTVLWSLGLHGIMAMASQENGLTAHAGGTQAAALALSGNAAVHLVATVGFANDSVALPAATGSGNIHLVSNQAAANSMQLFGAGTDTINGVATATGVAVAAGKNALCVDVAAGKWVALIA